MKLSHHFVFSSTFYYLTLASMYSAGSIAPSITIFGTSDMTQKTALSPSRITLVWGWTV